MIEKVKDGVIEMLYMNTAILPPDLGTKNHPARAHGEKAIRVMGEQ
jgi:hypothetical protein